jgi:hypothetical protein
VIEKIEDYLAMSSFRPAAKIESDHRVACARQSRLMDDLTNRMIRGHDLARRVADDHLRRYCGVDNHQGLNMDVRPTTFGT